MPYDRILLSINCRDDEKKVVDEAMEMASLCGASLTIAVINDPAAGKPHMLMDTLPEVSKADVIGRLKQFGYGDRTGEIDIQIIESESPVRSISEMTPDVDLLVMGHHARNPFVELISDPTDERVANRIDCPVLIVPLNDH